jgi:predicted extracellular nuclease
MAIASFVFAFSGSAAYAASPDLVISQVYGGGGNTSAPYTHDFVEIFNRGAAPVSLAGKSIQYASATGTGNLGSGGTQITELPAVTLQPGQYFLVQQAAGAVGSPLPTPDFVDTTPITMSGTAGKVALVNSATTLGCNGGSTPCSAAQLALIIDLVGYGGANFYETAPTALLSNTTAALRRVNGCTDTDVNNADFTVGTPTPRNTASPLSPCTTAPDLPVVATCPANLATTSGLAASVAVSANDGDDVVTGASITSGAVSGITLQSVVPGNPLTASLSVGASVAAGNYPVVITFSNGDVPAQSTQCTVDVNVAPPLPSPRIREIQGAAHLSPFNGQAVGNVPGIVTARRNNGFWMQDPEPDADGATSEGVFVFTNSAPTVQVGDSVRVTGTVTEFRAGGATSSNLTLTEITRPIVAVQSSGNALPPPVVIGAGGRAIPTTVIDDDSVISIEIETAGTFDAVNDGIDFLESLEGMRVQVNSPVATGPTNNFREISVLADGGANASVRTPRGGIVIRENDSNPERLIIDDVLASTPTVDTGDALSTIVAVVDYSFENFKLYPTTSPTVIADNGPVRESTSLLGTDDRLTIASYNVENLDANDVPTRFSAIAAQIVGALGTPDILALTEVQDDNGPVNDGIVSADQTAAKLIAAIQAAGGPAYQYRDIDPVDDSDGGEPGGNIRQAFLFNPARVTFVDRAGGTATAATTVQAAAGGGAELSFSPGRVNPTATAWTSSRKPLAAEFVFNYRKLFLIANHFNSKGGDDPLYGRTQPPIRTSEVQRAAQADAVSDFVQAIRAVDPAARVVVLGDLNDFQFSGTLSLLKSGSGLTNLIDTLPEGERYTYVFEGNSQSLDHVLVSPALAANAAPQVDVVHVNSEYSDQISDHDPVVASLSIPAPTLANIAGFYAPVDPPSAGFNGVNSGQNVPLKFYAATPAGAPITNLTTVNLSIVPVVCTTTSADAGDVAEADGSGVTLQNLGGGYYQYNWKTAKTDTGCRRVTLTLPEPAYLTLTKPAALFQFKR